MYVQMNEVVFFTMQNMYVCKYICMYEYALHSRTIVQQTSDHRIHMYVILVCKYVCMYICVYVCMYEFECLSRPSMTGK